MSKTPPTAVWVMIRGVWIKTTDYRHRRKVAASKGSKNYYDKNKTEILKKLKDKRREEK